MRTSDAFAGGPSLPVSPGAGRHPAGLLALKLKAFWVGLKDGPLSFWALNAYFFIEYVRPQQIYRSLDVLPYGDITLGLAILGYVLEGAPVRKLNLLDGLLGFFTLILVLSSVAAVDSGEAVAWWPQFLNWLIVYWLVTNLVTTERRLIIFWALFLLWSLKMSQHGARIWIARGGAFASWGATGTPGWFQNSGEFAIQMCILLAMSYHSVMALRPRLERWKFWVLMALLPGTAVLSLLASSSRGGQLALVGVVLFLIVQSRHRVRGLVIAGVILVGLWFVMPPEQKARFETMGDDPTSQSRLTYWRHGVEIANEYPVLGIGYKNWLKYYNTNYVVGGQLPHNIFIEAWSELGYSGLLAFLAMIGGTFLANRRTRRRAVELSDWGPFLRGASFGLDAALVGYVIAGFFVTVLYYPFFWVNLALTAALYETTRVRHRKVIRGRSRRRVSSALRPSEPPAGEEVPSPVAGGTAWPGV